MEDRIIIIKKGSIKKAVAALNKANLSFSVAYYNDEGLPQKTSYYQSKMNTYNEKKQFATSLGCKNLSEAIDKCGGARMFELKFAEYNG